jgi:hypothetical protein
LPGAVVTNSAINRIIIIEGGNEGSDFKKEMHVHNIIVIGRAIKFIEEDIF